MVFVVEGLITNILPTNEATLSTFTCSASSNHENIIHEYFVPQKLPAIRYIHFSNLYHTLNGMFTPMFRFCLCAGILCGSCKNESDGFTALLNTCDTCGYENMLYIVALGDP